MERISICRSRAYYVSVGQQFTRHTRGAQESYFLTSVYLKEYKFQTNVNNFDLIPNSWAILHYHWLYSAISGYLWLSPAISGYIWLSLPISGYLWHFLSISGYLKLYHSISVFFKLFQATLGFLRLSLIIPGYIWLLGLALYCCWIVPGLSLNYP